MVVASDNLRDLVLKAAEAFGTQDAYRYKVKKLADEGKKSVDIEGKTFIDLKKDTERFSAMLAAYGEQKKTYCNSGNYILFVDCCLFWNCK